jgi:hypothetical protein
VSATLGARIAERDAARFVGRAHELAQLEALLQDDPAANVVHLHGPGGIGKSALLRELARRATARGRSVHWLDGRELAPVPGALETALAPVAAARAPLLVLDTYERMAGVDDVLRRRLLPALPVSTVTVIAGRRPPAPGWFQNGWEGVTRELALGPLPPAAARALLAGHGIGDTAAARRIAGWADGSPLALTMLAGASGTPGRFAPERPDVIAALARRLLDAELDGEHVDVLAVAANARAVTPALLRAALPGHDADAALAWLQARSFAEPVGGGTALHDLVRRTLRAELRRRIPAREAELRRRIVDHLHARALAGDLLLTIDLADLADDAVLRSGYSWAGARRHHVDHVRPGDVAAIERRLERLGASGWFAHVRPWLHEAPASVSLARNADGALAGYSIAVTAEGAPPLAERDPVLGPWLAHARATGRENGVLWREAWDFTGEPGSGIQALVAMSGILRARLPNPRYAYLPIDPRLRAAVAFSRALDGRHLPELDVAGPPRFEAHVVDWGPGGLLGAQRDVVYRELGLTLRRRPRDPGAETVRQALRSLHRPAELARSPLATGAGQAERAAALRARLEDAIAHAFGTSAEERALHDLLVHAYVDPAPGHEPAARALHLSRATYFRRLRAATERVAAYLAERG